MENEIEKICKVSDCLYSQTGFCIRNNDPLVCEERLASLQISDVKEVILAEPVLQTPATIRQLKSSLTMSLTNVKELQESRYCKLVGILGIPSSGKTASLVSLYLLLAKNKLNGFEFLDSRSIMAFEDICVGARKWKETELPNQLTVHTELSDIRTAGFLHLRLNCLAAKQAIDILLTDLPGEWTNDLIDSNRKDRFDFLKSADRVWIMVNGLDLHTPKERHHTIHRVETLIQRLQAFLGEQMADVVLVVTHTDSAVHAGKYLNHFITDRVNGFSIKVLEIASFSTQEGIEPGTGISQLIQDLVNGRPVKKPPFWPSGSMNSNDRNYLRFSNDR